MSIIIQERTVFIEQILNGVGYGKPLRRKDSMILTIIVGIVLSLYIQILAQFIPKRRIASFGAKVLMGLTTIMMILATLYLAGCIVLSTRMFIDDRNYPGGPIGYLIKMYSVPVTMMANAAYPIDSWICDGLMVSARYLVVTELMVMDRFIDYY